MNPLNAVARQLGGRSIAVAVTLAFIVAATIPLVAYRVTPGGPAERAAVGVGLAALLSLLLGLGVSRQFRAQLRRSMDQLHDIAEGAYHAPAPELGMREFRELSATMNYMRERLRETTERLVHRAFHDPLTGLPNRALFMTELEAALDAHSDEPDRVAVLFFDLDRFKVLNDTLGHDAGDRLLVLVTRRLGRLSNQNGLFARLAGDEFVFLVVGGNAESRACALAEAIAECFRQPFTIGDHEFYVSASVGIASSRAGAPNAMELLRWADIAVYRAKANSRAIYICYDATLDEMPRDRIDLESALRRAIERKQLLLRYQPEYDLRTGEIVGMEALLRWNHPVRGVLTPGEFIALAEETGEIHNIGEWVLGEACRRAAALNLQRNARGEPPIVVAVNLSSGEFRRDTLAEHIARTLLSSGLEPAALRLEITESVLMDDVPATIRVLSELKALGVRIAVDDFGTGYSSLSYLQRLPVDVLKIDQSFVSTLGRDARSLPIVAAIVQLGTALDMSVTAEGIETPDQLHMLTRAGCVNGQGFYLSEAVDPDAFDDILEHARLARDSVA